MRFMSLLLAVSSPVMAQATPMQVPAASVTLFQDVRIFDGTGSALTGPMNVLVRGNTIERISARPIPVDRRADTRVINAGGRTLMPGLIDAHAHLMMSSLPMQALLAGDAGFLNLAAAKAAEAQLMQGFTSVRDLGGPVFGLKRAIDMGLATGPRIYPSGAMISQTGGHGDFRFPYELGASKDFPVSISEALGAARIADGADQVLQAARANLALGASQVKLMAGGGVSSMYDPIDVAQYTEREFRAAVDAAENWGTYVAVHAYTPRAIQAALRAGVLCIEHGQMADEATARMMAEKGAWWSLQPFLDDEDANPREGEGRLKQQQVQQGTETAFRLAKQHGIKVAFGTDALFDAKAAMRNGKQLAKLTRWFTPAEVLAIATSRNAELLAMSGPRNPYAGKLGVIQEGALADLILVDGDPVANIQLVADPWKNFLVIMKDGKIYKNALAT